LILFISKLGQVRLRTSNRHYRDDLINLLSRTTVSEGPLSNGKSYCVKKLQFLSILLVFAIACKKSGDKTIEPVKNSLIGKWTYTEHYGSSGGPGEWRPVNPSNQIIEFNSDGTFVPCESFLKDANHFEILDSVTVKFQPAFSGSSMMSYSIDTIARELILTPIPLCIEGCADKFKR
jgi:hypothetical protein